MPHDSYLAVTWQITACFKTQPDIYLAVLNYYLVSFKTHQITVNPCLVFRSPRLIPICSHHNMVLGALGMPKHCIITHGIGT